MRTQGMANQVFEKIFRTIAEDKNYQYNTLNPPDTTDIIYDAVDNIPVTKIHNLTLTEYVFEQLFLTISSDKFKRYLDKGYTAQSAAYDLYDIIHKAVEDYDAGNFPNYYKR